MKNFEDIINLLLKYGADPNIKDNNNIYPLQYAIKCNSIKFVLALINSNKINLSQRDFKEKKMAKYDYVLYSSIFTFTIKPLNTNLYSFPIHAFINTIEPLY